jgi:hypothetical protein
MAYRKTGTGGADSTAIVILVVPAVSLGDTRTTLGYPATVLGCPKTSGGFR